MSIEQALDKACPKITINNKVPKSTWATDEHTEMKKKVTKLYKQAKQTGNQNDWNLYRTADKDFKNRCTNDRNKAWRKFKECMQTEQDMASLARLAQRKEHHNISTLKHPSGGDTSPGKETIDLLTGTHFPAATTTRKVTYNNRRNMNLCDIDAKYTDWITDSLITEALAGFEKKKSPGPDGLKPLIFEHLPLEFITHLRLIYKSAIHLGYTPKLWKQSRVIYLSKPGKESYQLPKSFRPISLSNYLLKGLERLVGWRMDTALRTHPLHPRQHGFQTGKSTESAISSTTDYIEKYVMNRQHCVGVFLDISAAFDSIRPAHVRQALLKHGGDPELVQWYFSYMTHRDILVTMHGQTVDFSTGVGFPQGGVCSAKFWLIAFDYAMTIINRYQILGTGYADDCAALAGGRRLDHALKKLQKMLDELSAWGKTCGLKFNPDKSVAVVFTRRRKIPPFNLKIDGKDIEYKKEVKYLGITLDSKLHWTKHIEDKIAKTKRFLHCIAQITRNNWGPKPKLMRWAYTGMVRPMLCYGAMIWGHRAPELAEKLRRINRMAINTFAHFPKSTPTTALEVALDVMPIHLFCLKEALAAKIRLTDHTNLTWQGTNQNKTHSVSHLRHWENKLESHQIHADERDECPPTVVEKQYRINTDSFTGAGKHRTHTEFNIYTDGSQYHGQTGSGFIIYKGQKEVMTGSMKLPDYSTVFQAEVVAIRLACEQINKNASPKFVKIFVDSRAALSALQARLTKSRTVLDTINSINKLAKNACRVTLNWVPAHKGFRGNEAADLLAKQGTTSEHLISRSSVRKPRVAINNDIRRAAYDEWTKEWATQTKANHARSFYDSPDANKAKYVYKLARLELGRFIRIISGHNNLRFFQNKLNPWIDPACRFCDHERETVMHFLYDCPRFSVSRREKFLDRIPTADRKWSVRAIIEFSYTPELNEAFEDTSAQDGAPTNATIGRTDSDSSCELEETDGSGRN